MRNANRVGLVLLLTLTIVILSTSAAVAQEDVPTIVFYATTVNFNTGGSVPSELEKVRNYIQEQTGVRVEAVLPPDRNEGQTEKLNLLLASNDQLDLFLGDWSTYEDAVIPLNDLLEEHGQNILASWSEQAWNGCTNTAGEILCIPRNAPRNPYTNWVRSDYLEQAGLEVPTTLEEYETMLAAFEEINPEFFITTRLVDAPGAFLGAFVPYGSSNWLDESDNTIKPWVLHPGVRDWAAKLAEWYEAGYIFADAYTSWDPPEVFRTCNVGVHMGWYSRITIIVPEIQSACEGMEFVRAVELEGPEGYWSTVELPLGNGYMIPRKSQNPEAVIKLIDWAWSDPENLIITNWGIPEEDWQYVDEENYVVQVSEDSGYVREFGVALGVPGETQFRVDDPTRQRHSEYLRDELGDFTGAKMPFDADVVYDQGRVLDAVPTFGDIQRVMDEQLVLFLTNQRPIDEWDDFIDTLYRAGMQGWIDELTLQYNEAMGGA